MASGGRRRKKSSSRPKAKRTRYLSLSRIIVKSEVQTPEDDDVGRASSPPPEETEVKEDGAGGGGGQQQVEPFPLHHEASTLFEALPAPSLSDILGASASASPPSSASPDASSSGGESGLPTAGDEDLARRALRGRERWVYCCSCTSSPTTTTTSSSSLCSSVASTGAPARSLLQLKLDYDEILVAWAGRGSLYIGRAAPPELETVLVEVQPPQHHPTSAAPACAWRWSAPEAARSERAESLKRYKEKRRNRLFDKRIRYEVRRANAVKRPRFKGRFIKEYDEEV